MSYRNKTYVAFDADNDMRFYRLMEAWKYSENIEFNFHNAHDYNTIRPSSSEDTIKSNLRERMNNSKIFILLAGETTRYLRKFVHWEIEQALKAKLPVIVVNLNGKRSMDDDRCPSILKSELAIHVSFNAKIIKYALDNWPGSHLIYGQQGHSGPYFYKDTIYNQLGL